MIIREALRNKEQKAKNTPLQIEQQKAIILDEIVKLENEKDKVDDRDVQVNGDTAATIKEIQDKIDQKTQLYKDLSKKGDQLAMSPTIQPGIDIENLDKQLQDLEKEIIEDFNK